MIEAMNGIWNFPKDKVYHEGDIKLKNNHGLDMRLYGWADRNEYCPDAGVGVLVVTKELKNTFKGYLVKFPWADFEAKAYRDYIRSEEA